MCAACPFAHEARMGEPRPVSKFNICGDVGNIITVIAAQINLQGRWQRRPCPN